MAVPNANRDKRITPPLNQHTAHGKPINQYDYRHTDGELFSTVAPTLEECRTRRDEWLKKKTVNKFVLFLGFKRLGEFDTISEAKKYAQESGETGVFNLLGDNYRDAWYVFEDENKGE